MKPADLTPDELLTTTRTVRRRLDLDRPVPPELIRECVSIALQAPTGGNSQNGHFVVVMDAERRAGLAALYRRAWTGYRKAPGSVHDRYAKTPAGPLRDQMGRVVESADYLAENLHRVPVLVIPCIGTRLTQVSGDFANVAISSTYGSILPAAWSFMLAARARGLGAAWTTAHLTFERDAAALLAIPYESVTQVALLPTAYHTGSTFKPALRRATEDLLHFDRW